MDERKGTTGCGSMGSCALSPFAQSSGRPYKQRWTYATLILIYYACNAMTYSYLPAPRRRHGENEEEEKETKAI